MFVGRERERALLEDLAKRDVASIAVVYGRRRTGKTTLVEYVFAKRNLIKIEGIEGKDTVYQLQSFIDTLKLHFQNPLLQSVKPTSWQQAFNILAELVKEGEWTVYFEELQWMAEYKPGLIAELKPVWDNYLSKNSKLILILCGSAPSFFISHVIKSQSLYNRSALEIRLDEFSVSEARSFLPNYSIRSYLDAYLTLGGIPPYLEKANTASSVYLSLCEQSFKKNSFFRNEFEKIFISSFGKNPTYRAIIELISKHRKLTRNELIQDLESASGGALTKYLIDLEECGFINKVVPLSKPRTSKLAYYQINDPYLHFYFHFIEPRLREIDGGDFDAAPTGALDSRTYTQWLGFSFERLCRQNAHAIASALGFSGINYKAGTFFKRRTISKAGLQIDLMFKRPDKAVTICEIKYSEAKIGLDIIEEVEQKISRLDLPKNVSIQRVLISASGVNSALKGRHYFDAILGIEDLI